MLTRVVLVSPVPLEPGVLDLLPMPAESVATDFGVQATCTADVEDPDALRAELRAATTAAVGVITGELAQHPAQLVMFDVDSPLTTTEAIDLLAEHAGKGAEVAAITERAMRGELDFAESLHARVATLAGLPVSIFNEVGPRMTLSPGATQLIQRLHQAGVKVGVTSGGFTQLVGPLADRFGLDFYSANHLEISSDGQTLTGKVTGTVVDKYQKLADVQRFAAQHHIPLDRCVAVGDGANDLAMLDAVGLGIAYCAKPVTANRADVAIGFPRLDAVAAFALL